MGAYLSEPVTEKFSNDETSDYIEVGASSMQGWRISQEDAHNCILNFDKNVSFFAVYDGHGGAEVATYCAENLPEFLKNLSAYKKGDYEQALKDAFLKFDETLLKEEIVEILKRLAGERNPDRESELEEEEEEEDLAELCQEGSLPLDQVLEKYKGAAAKFQNVNKIKNDSEAIASSSGTSKSFSRGRHGTTDTDRAGPSCSSTSVQRISNRQNTDLDDVTVSSSNAENEKSINKNLMDNEKVNKSPSILKENGGIKCSSPDSSSANCKDSQDKIKNGDITFYGESNSGKSEGVSSTSAASSSSTHIAQKENGAVMRSLPSLPLLTSSASSCSITSSIKECSDSEKAAICSMDDEDETSSEEDDTDFHAEENSSTEDGEEDCEPCDEETEEENEDGEEGEDEGLLDDGFCANMIEEPGKDSGCTAVIALLHGKDLYVANAGDSRCVLCRGGKAVEMSLDHKPEDEKEKSRIYKAGGKVTMDGRVNGGLNLSRAIGDHAYKMNKDLPPEEQMISALPDVKKLVITPEDEFMILACDGIWNFMTSDEVVQFIKKRLDEGKESISKICEELFDNCLAPHTIGDGTGCDNMTAVLVRFKQPNILNLPTKLEMTTTTFTTTVAKKRSVLSISDNENTVEESLSKRAKTDNNEDDDNDDDDDDDDDNDTKEQKENINSIVSTTTTTTTPSSSLSSSQFPSKKETPASSTTQNEEKNVPVESTIST